MAADTEVAAPPATIGAFLRAAARRNGGRTFLTFESASFSYARVDELADEYAAGLAALGVRQGDHVALMLDNRPEFLWTCFGLGRLGAVVVTINTAAKGDLLAYFLGQSGSSTLVLGAEFAERVATLPAGLGLRRVVVVDPGPQTAEQLQSASVPVHDLASVLIAGSTVPDVTITRSDPASIMFTSGTTGPSKGVVSPHSQPLGVGHQVATAYGYRPDDVLYTCLPLFHANALWYTCYAALAADASVALARRFSARTFWSEIARTGATQFNFIGTMANVVRKLEPSPEERAHRVRLALIAPAPASLIQEFDERYGIQVVSAFAATETFLVTVLDASSPIEKAGSAGRPAPGARVRVVNSGDGEDVDVPTGVAGEILVAADDPGCLLSHYHDMPEATARALRDGWFHTGDRGHLDEDGYLHFIDRIKDVIRRRGENISAHEVEAILVRHPDVAEVAAIPVPSELGEDDVMVFVVPTPGSPRDEESIVRFADANMAFFMVPRFVEFIDELPKTPNTRIEKYKLKERAAGQRDRLWDREATDIRLTR
jgi:carnitine-CoA ligase